MCSRRLFLDTSCGGSEETFWVKKFRPRTWVFSLNLGTDRSDSRLSTDDFFRFQGQSRGGNLLLGEHQLRYQAFSLVISISHAEFAIPRLGIFLILVESTRDSVFGRSDDELQ